MLLAWEQAVASKDAPVTGIEDMCPSPNPSGFDWLSDDDDFGRFSVIDDDKDAPTGDFGEEDAADVVGDGALAKPFPAPLV